MSVKVMNYHLLRVNSHLFLKSLSRRSGKEVNQMSPGQTLRFGPTSVGIFEFR